MSKYYISINQFAEFSLATKSSKMRILRQQKVPNKLLIPWYQKAKSTIRKFFSDINDYSVIDAALQELKQRVPLNNRQKIDRDVSIEALTILKKVKLPRAFKYMEYEVIIANEKKILINDVDIIVAPEIIIKAKYQGKVVYGAIKIHVSKGKPFDQSQATYVAATVYSFLRQKVANSGDQVLPELCFCLDVFAEKLVPAPPNTTKIISEVKLICDEIKSLWSSS